MPCYRPLLAHRGLKTTENGKRPLSFNIHEAYQDLPVMVPCGKCIGCKTDKATQWAARCYHESKLHKNNYFVTLTYDENNLPPGGTLVKEHLQDFIRRLRKSNPNEKIRYYACGEYGTKGTRPHYHILLFGHSFNVDNHNNLNMDLRLYTRNKQPGQQLYTSESLKTLWPFGFSTVGEFSQQSAMYVAKYSIKKITGELAAAHYEGRLPEFALMSLKPGIGHDWIKKYTSDCYPKDYFTIKGRKFRPPRYYDDYLKKIRPKCLEYIKNKRIEKAKENDEGGVRRYYVANVKEQLKKHFDRRKFENE
ncbi:MAG: replication initiator protein [Arizlama microvirus]|nr:MAG: replication initiator protein [Arizlama microvirus]